MVKRKKSKFENFFNLNQYRKRAGAKSVSQSLQRQSYDDLKAHILAGEPPKTFQSYMIKNLDEHLAHLKTAFSGRSELLFYHAQLIVLIRRQADLKKNVAQFRHLWEAEAEFLLGNLNMRWLIAAIDTFIDHGESDAERAILLSAVVLINTIKLYETERFLLAQEHTTDANYDAARFSTAQENCFNLFDELPSFRVGVDDTLRNMRWRMEAASKKHSLAHQLLMAVFLRVNEQGSVYTRFKNRHEKPRNAWW